MKKVLIIIGVVAAIVLPCFAGYYTCKRCGGSGIAGTKNCHACNGTGQRVVMCSTCSGRGEVRDSYGDLQKCPSCNGWGKEYATCPSCSGSGEEPWTCPVCHGSGQVYVEE